MTEEISTAFERNERLGFAAASVIIAAMMFCAGLTFEWFLARLVPDWSLGFLPWAALLAAVEAIYSQSFVHRWSELGWERISYRLSEALVIVFLVKSVFYFRMGGEVFLEEVSRYGQNFLDNFFTPEVSAALLVVFLVWMIAARMAAHLLDMGEDRLILEPGARPGFFLDRGQVRRKLAGNVFFFGAVLVFLAALTRVDLDVVWGNAGPVEATAFNVVVYFVLGLMLLSMAQFAVMRGRWGWEHTQIRQEIGRAWLRYSAVFFLVLLAVILVLPTGYSLGLFQTFRVFFQVLTGLIAFLFYLLLLPIMLLVARLLGNDSLEDIERPENPFDGMGRFPQAPEAVPGAAVPLLEWIRSVFFWAAFLFVLVYAFVQFAKHNEALWGRIQSVPLLRWLVTAWENLLAWLLGVGETAQEAVRAGIQQVRSFRAGRLAQPEWNFLGINRLSPREKVFFFYRALLRRAEENEVGRGKSQTPLEYSRKLLEAYPESDGEIEGITAGFEDARYAGREITEADASRVKAIWEKIRRAFTRRNNQGNS